MQLPDLCSWVAPYEPPLTIPSAVFPPIEELHPNSRATPWLRFLVVQMADRPQNGLAIPSERNTKES
jgi:hypothetical protein